MIKLSAITIYLFTILFAASLSAQEFSQNYWHDGEVYLKNNSKEPLIYHWYKNGVIAVDSSNSNSYSTTVYSSDNESTFKVIVTSANKGNIESVSASLTVNDVSFYWSEPFLWS